MVRPTINSEKHIVQVTLASTGIGTSVTQNIAQAQQNPSGSAANVVRVGTDIKAVYVELWFLAASQQPGTTVVIVEKLPGAAANITAGDMADLHSYNNKKNIFYTTMGIVGDANTNPVPLIRQWIKIPKGKQRMGLNDRIQFTVLAQTDTIEWCGLMIYKAYN